MKKFLIYAGAFVGLLIIAAGSIYLIYFQPFMERMKVTNVIQYDPSLTLVLGGGGNSGILASDSLVIVIDSKMDDAAKELSETVRKIAGQKPILVINTHWHPDHSDGNIYYEGQTILAGGNYTPEAWVKESGAESLPTAWLKDKLEIKMGDDTVTILNFAKDVHTPSDIVVYLHRRKMLFGGDVILNKQAPAIFGAADPDGYLWAFTWLPSHFDIQHVVPGHGAVGGIEVINDFRQYFEDMKLAAHDPAQRDALLAKYDSWAQIPVLMAPSSTMKAFQRK